MVAMGLLVIAVKIKYNWVKTDTETNSSVFQASRQQYVTFNMQHLKIDIELRDIEKIGIEFSFSPKQQFHCLLYNGCTV